MTAPNIISERPQRTPRQGDGNDEADHPPYRAQISRRPPHLIRGTSSRAGQSWQRRIIRPAPSCWSIPNPVGRLHRQSRPPRSRCCWARNSAGRSRSPMCRAPARCSATNIILRQNDDGHVLLVTAASFIPVNILLQHAPFKISDFAMINLPHAARLHAVGDERGQRSEVRRTMRDLGACKATRPAFRSASRGLRRITLI